MMQREVVVVFFVDEDDHDEVDERARGNMELRAVTFYIPQERSHVSRLSEKKKNAPSARRPTGRSFVT